jgi:hypothetical protein
VSDGEADYDEHSDGEQSEIGNESDDVRCEHCVANVSPDGYVCLPDAIHVFCYGCHRPMPDRPNVQSQKCQFCNARYCNMYFQSDCVFRSGLKMLKGECVSYAKRQLNMARLTNVMPNS